MSACSRCRLSGLTACLVRSFYLTKIFVVETSYNYNLIALVYFCYVKCSTSLLTRVFISHAQGTWSTDWD